jgi:hypothetical protein
LRLADQRRQPLAQLGGRLPVKAMVNLAGVEQVLALAPADIDAVPFVAVVTHRRGGDRFPSKDHSLLATVRSSRPTSVLLRPAFAIKFGRRVPGALLSLENGALNVQ